MLIRKIWTVIRLRPTYLWQYSRGSFLFLRSQILSGIFLDKQKVILENNVRFQRLSNFLTASEQSSIHVGANSIIYEHARLEAHGSGRIEVGASSILGDVRIVSRKNIRLGKRLLTSWNVLLQDFDPHPTDSNLRAQQVEKMVQDFFPRWSGVKKNIALSWEPPAREIIIGDDVWLGANVTILKGTRIGSGSIVAAGSVVTGGEFAEKSLIAGNPAKLVKVIT